MNWAAIGEHALGTPGNLSDTWFRQLASTDIQPPFSGHLTDSARRVYSSHARLADRPDLNCAHDLAFSGQQVECNGSTSES